jgi:hypothetical protein
MDDYAALVERVCFVLPKVLGCLLLSEDGLVLCASPEDGNVAEAAWRHFFAIQEPVRGFLAFADQNWVYVRHGAYAVFVVADVGVRPGVLVDQLEQVLTTAVTGAAETFHVPEAVSPAPLSVAAPTPVPMPASIPPAREPAPIPAPGPEAVVRDVPEVRPVADVEPIAVAVEVEPKKGESKKGDSKKGDAKKAEAAPPLAPPAASAAMAGSWAQVGVADRSDDDDGEVDRVQLAQEFSGLLQMDRADDEASS